MPFTSCNRFEAYVAHLLQQEICHNQQNMGNYQHIALRFRDIKNISFHFPVGEGLFKCGEDRWCSAVKIKQVLDLLKAVLYGKGQHICKHVQQNNRINGRICFACGPQPPGDCRIDYVHIIIYFYEPF